MFLKTTVNYDGDFKCTAVNEASGKSVITKANQEQPTEFSPIDLLCSALGTCTLSVLAVASVRENLKLDGMKTEVVCSIDEKTHRPTGFDITITMPKGLEITDVQKKKLEKYAHSCPVKASLNPDLKINTVFVY
ncbi:OsmC family protein [bacterium]|nr:OsmC family protein [bacterium]